MTWCWWLSFSVSVGLAVGVVAFGPPHVWAPREVPRLSDGLMCFFLGGAGGAPGEYYLFGIWLVSVLGAGAPSL